MPCRRAPAEVAAVEAHSGRRWTARCPPPIWVGNVDATWFDENGPAQVNKHFGNLGVCPGGPKSCIHVLTGCANIITWAFQNVCPGWTATLENEDHSPAPANLPAGWTGWICIAANAGVPVGSTCCLKLNLLCMGVPATIDVCAYACTCPTPARQESWGRIRTIYR